MNSIAVKPAAPLRLTRRGRVVVVAALLFAVLGLMVVLGGLANASRTAGQAQDVRHVEVHSGDTLYDIAAEYAAPGHIRDKVQEIRDVNDIGSVLRPGTELVIPLD